MSTVELRLAVASGDVGAAVRVWREGMECWTPVAELPELGLAVPGLGQWVEPPQVAAAVARAAAAAAVEGADQGASDQPFGRDALPTEPTPTCSPADVPVALVAPVRVVEPAPLGPAEPFELTATPTLAATPDEVPTQAMFAVRANRVGRSAASAERPRLATGSAPSSMPEPSAAASLPTMGLTIAPRARPQRAHGRFAAAAAALCALGVVITAVRSVASTASSAAVETAGVARIAPLVLASAHQATHLAGPRTALGAAATREPALRRAPITTSPPDDLPSEPALIPLPTPLAARGVARAEPRPRDPGQKRMRRASAR